MGTDIDSHQEVPAVASGLYVHVPYCRTKCGYCDFYSVPVEGKKTGALVDRVIDELRTRVAAWPHPIRTVFCGGGTPTVLPVPELRALLDELGRTVQTHECTEFTVEANPDTIDRGMADLLAASGVTRVSLGAQSFFAKELAALDRDHDPADIAAAIETLQRAGFTHMSLDLMFGIPGQTLGTWAQSLRRAIDLGVDHVSCYGLTYEPATRLTARRRLGQIEACPEDLEADMFELAGDTLAAAGFDQYELSNYARPKGQCLHNLIYWRNGPHLGIGPSAVGFDGRRRYKNVRDTARYVEMIDQFGHAESDVETLDAEAIMTELIMMQLRLSDGLSIADYQARTGLDPRRQFGTALARLSALGLVATTDTHIRLTRVGRPLADGVIAEIVSVGSM